MDDLALALERWLADKVADRTLQWVRMDDDGSFEVMDAAFRKWTIKAQMENNE